MAIIPTQPTHLTWLLQLFSVSCHSDTIKVIETELQAVLNTLTELNFQDSFKNGKALQRTHRCGRGLL
jgi:hypothetical protein